MTTGITNCKTCDKLVFIGQEFCSIKCWHNYNTYTVLGERIADIEIINYTQFDYDENTIYAIHGGDSHRKVGGTNHIYLEGI